jgi:radical SAM superfamily enzyme YgiQ (UPF0313 family)
MPKVLFAVPPFNTDKGQPQVQQNRQQQYFKDENNIFPVVPSLFLTMLVHAGNEVMLIDSVAEKISESEFAKILSDMKPDYIVFEENTMVVKRYWEIINAIKTNLPGIKIILCGLHTTALPEESKANCKADYFIQGGKWYREAFKIISQKEWEGKLPAIDRYISRWWLYSENNGNYKYVPATYTMAAQDCWYRPKHQDGSTASCTFCTYVDYHPENMIRPVDEFLDEVQGLINIGFKEFFDDSGTFPVGKWLHEFCDKMINEECEGPDGKPTTMNKFIRWGCNMRFKALKPEDFQLMAKAGCRFILWGFESANQTTLDKLNKGYSVKEVAPNLIASRMAGIWNHLTVMMGYPWETLKEEYNTYKMVKWILLNDWAASMQATIFMPYPGTTAYKELDKEGLIITKDWDKWDMCHQVAQMKYPFKEALKLQRKYYNIGLNPKFLLNKLWHIRTADDVKQYYRIGKKVVNRFAGLHEEVSVG